MGNALHSLARATEDAGDLQAARIMYLDALEALHSSGDHLRSGEATFDLGRLSLVAGDHESARILFEEALQRARSHAWSMFMAVVLAGLAEVARRQDNVALAHAHAGEALEWSLKSGDQGWDGRRTSRSRPPANGRWAGRARRAPLCFRIRLARPRHREHPGRSTALGGAWAYGTRG